MKQSEISKKYILDMGEKLPKIVEYLVGFFGEQYREKIEKNLANVWYIFSGSDQDVALFFESAGKDDLLAGYREQEGKFCESGGYYKSGSNPDIDDILENNRDFKYDALENFLTEDSYKLLQQNELKFTQNALQTLYYDLFTDQEWAYAHYLHDVSPDLKNVCSVIHYALSETLYDTTIIHEHIHASTLFMRRVDNNHALAGTGFLKAKQRKGEIGENVGKDDYENMLLVDLDELFTEYFAMKIIEKMQKDNCVFVCKEDEHYENTYRTAFPATEAFFDNFLNEAKTFYMNNDVEGLKKWMGAENFKKFSKANSKLMGFTIDEIEDDRQWFANDKPLSYIYDHIDSFGDKVNDSEYFCAMRDIKQVVDFLIEKYKNNDDDSEPK